MGQSGQQTPDNIDCWVEGIAFIVERLQRLSHRTVFLVQNCWANKENIYLCGETSTLVRIPFFTFIGDH